MSDNDTYHRTFFSLTIVAETSLIKPLWVFPKSDPQTAKKT